MTTIKYDLNNYTVELTGHAGYDVPGKDIVCAGVSTLFFTLVNTLDEMGRDRIRPLHPRVWMGDGEAGVTARVDDDNREKVRTVFETVAAGFRMMAEKYPENVKFEIMRNA